MNEDKLGLQDEFAECSREEAHAMLHMIGPAIASLTKA